MSRAILNHVECEILVCGNCGVTHAIPAAKYDAALDEGGFWFCPNGHNRGWEKSASAREAERRANERIKQDNARLADEVQEARRQTEKVEAKLRRQGRRIAVGVCPCCNRTFAKLAMHMKSKHPTYNVVPLKAAQT